MGALGFTDHAVHAGKLFVVALQQFGHTVFKFGEILFVLSYACCCVGAFSSWGPRGRQKSCEGFAGITSQAGSGQIVGALVLLVTRKQGNCICKFGR